MNKYNFAAPMRIALASLLLLLVVQAFDIGPNSCSPCLLSDYKEDYIQQHHLFDSGARNKTLKCIFRLMDRNLDWKISEKEFQTFVAKHLHQNEKPIAHWSLFQKRCECDCDTRAISFEEALVKFGSCLSTNIQIQEAYERFCFVTDESNHEDLAH